MAVVRIPQLPVEFVVPADMELTFAETAMTQFTGEDAPLQARCIARYVLTVGQAEILANTLREQIDTLRADMASVGNQGKKDTTEIHRNIPLHCGSLRTAQRPQAGSRSGEISSSSRLAVSGRHRAMTNGAMGATISMQVIAAACDPVST